MNQLKPGFRFNPEDHELVHYYLRNKVLGRPLPLPIRDLDLYQPNSPKPCQIFQGCTAKNTFFFTPVTKQDGRWDGVDRQSAGGTYRITSDKKEIRVDTPFQEDLLIGFTETLSFVDTTLTATQDNNNRNWILDQISLSNYPVAGDDQQRWVVCRLSPIKRPKVDDDDDDDGGGGGRPTPHQHSMPRCESTNIRTA